MKRRILLSIFIIAMIIFTFNPPLFAESKDLKIAMILWRGETDAERGLKDGLKELGYSVKYTVLDAKQKKSNLGSILRQQLNPDNFDYVYTFGTTVSKQTKKYLNERVPHVFNIVSDPVRAGLVNSLDASGGNICGVKSGVELSLQIKSAKKIIDFKKLGIIFNSREKNSNIALNELIELSSQLNFEVIKLRSPPARNRLEWNLQRLIDNSVKVDAVYLPSDSYVISKAKYISDQLKLANVKSIGAVKTYIKKGALLGSVADYYMLGKKAAKIVDKHQKGKQFHSIFVEVPENPKLVINTTTSKMLDFNIPESVLENAVIIK